MSLLDLVPVVGDVAGGITDYYGAKHAAQAQRRAADQQLVANKQARGLSGTGYQDAMKTIKDQYDKSQGYYDPYLKAGEQGLTSLSQFIGSDPWNSGPLANKNPYSVAAYNGPNGQYKSQQFNYQSSPGYQFQVQQARDALQNSAASRGTIGTSNSAQQLQHQAMGLAAQDIGNQFNRYQGQEQLNQGQANQNYQNAYGQYGADRAFGANQYQQNINNYLNSLQSKYASLSGMAGIGERAAGASANLATNYGNNQGNLQTGYGQSQADYASQAGDLQASRILGPANTWNQYTGQLGNRIQNGLSNIQQAANGFPMPGGGGQNPYTFSGPDSTQAISSVFGIS